MLLRCYTRRLVIMQHMYTVYVLIFGTTPARTAIHKVSIYLRALSDTLYLITTRSGEEYLSLLDPNIPI